MEDLFSFCPSNLTFHQSSIYIPLVLIKAPFVPSRYAACPADHSIEKCCGHRVINLHEYSLNTESPHPSEQGEATVSFPAENLFLSLQSCLYDVNVCLLIRFSTTDMKAEGEHKRPQDSSLWGPSSTEKHVRLAIQRLTTLWSVHYFFHY